MTVSEAAAQRFDPADPDRPVKAFLQEHQALFGFGDAVCVPVIEWIARNYLNPVWTEEYAQEELGKLAEAAVTYRKTARR